MSTQPAPRHAATALLEVVALHERDVEGADEGGADRLLLVADPGRGDHVDDGGLSPEPALVSAVCKETELPVRVVLRLNDGLATTGGELSRLVGLGEDYLAVGAAGLCFGFLTADLDVDVEVCAHLAQRLPGVPWTFHRGFDATLETQRAWRQVRGLPGLDAVLTGGSARGMSTGSEDLLDRLGTDPAIAPLVLAGGGLAGEQVPWLARAGVGQFHVGSAVRPGGSWSKAHVDASHVRSWRMLLDDALDRARGRPVE